MKIELTKEQVRDLNRARDCGYRHLVLVELEGGRYQLETASLDEVVGLQANAASGMSALVEARAFLAVEP